MAQLRNPVKGDKVHIKRRDVFHLRNRKFPVPGVVTSVDGAYIMVRPEGCEWEIELYPSEIELLVK